ncbi:MAG: type II CRISPR RNA-guided endonuclease Cas9, partial [Mailhella sp.]
MRIAENVVLGLDLGNGSIGWALIDENPETLERKLYSKTLASGEVMYALGSRIIDVPENPKTKELLNVARRQKRGVRRVIARRASRMRALRRLFAEYGCNIDTEETYHCRGKVQDSPWELRRRALYELLSPEQFAVALLHIAKHRGFRSNSKNEGSDAEQGKINSAMEVLKKELDADNAETVGEYFALRGGMRNRNNYRGEAQYTQMLKRSWQEEEARLLFERQRSFGSSFASQEMEASYASLAFEQRELKSVSSMVGRCVFCEDDRRAPAYAPTAELFRFLQGVVN